MVTEEPELETSMMWDGSKAESATHLRTLKGVFPEQALREAVEAGFIRDAAGHEIPDENFQPASIDLRLGARAYRLRSSFLPGAQTVEQKLKQHQEGNVINLRKGGILERNRPYLIPLKEECGFPDWIRGRTNPKSSTGRVDVFTRVIGDRAQEFDELPAGYKGPLYVEVFTRSFLLKVSEDLTLNQIRLSSSERGMPMSADSLACLHAEEPLVFGPDGEPIDAERIRSAGGVYLGVDLSPRRDPRFADGEEGHPLPAGFKALPRPGLLDLTRTDNDPRDFWEPVWPVRPGDRDLVLEPDEFYLLQSRERLSVPPRLAAEMVAYDTTSGELRTHYAGFFDPGFGAPPASPVPAVLEVRARDVPFAIEHGQRVCRLDYEKMAQPPKMAYGALAGSHYNELAGQQRMLSKYFGPHDGSQIPFPIA